MFFTQIDSICDIAANESITATKNLTLAEEYLQDHFPGFPVMPGVLMLEALAQAGMWLVRYSEDFQHSMVVLREARNVKYSGFVQPGQQLRLSASILKQDNETTNLKAQGEVDGTINVSARLVLHRFNLADRNAADEALDRMIIDRLRHGFRLLFPNHRSSASADSTRMNERGD